MSSRAASATAPAEINVRTRELETTWPSIRTGSTTSKGMPASRQNSAEDLDVAATVVAEEEVPPFDHPAGTKLAQDDAIEEFAGGEPQQCRIGRIGHDGIDAQFVQQACLVLGPA